MKHSAPIKAILDRALRRVEAQGFDGATRLVGELTKVHSAVAAMEKSLSMPSPAHDAVTRARHKVEAGERLAQSLEKMRSAANELLNLHMNAVRGRLQDATGLRPAATADRHIVHGEIRAVVRGMDDSGKRALLVREAIKARDAEVLSAVLLAPPFLTGLDERLRDDLRADYERQVAPEVIAEMEALLDADRDVSAALRSAHAAADDTRNAEFLRRLDEASAAAKEFNRATGELGEVEQ